MSLIWQRVRQPVAYLVMSVVVIWHTLAMVIAPAPENDITELARVPLQPYLTALRLDNQWDFFAPIVGEGVRLRYDIQDRTGKVHAFMGTDELSWYHPTFLWFRSWYNSIIDDPDRHAEPAAVFLCRKHADLRPLAISFYSIQEEPFTREDFLAGKERMGPGFFTVTLLRGLRCPDP